MKKKILLLAMIAAMSVTALAGCGSDKETSSSSSTSSSSTSSSSSSTASSTTSDESSDEASEIVGDWTLTSIIDATGTEYTLEEYCAANGVDSAGIQAVYSFNDDGTATASIGGIGTDMTYDFDGETITYTVTASGTTAELTYDGETLSAVDANSGMKSVFTR